VTSTRAGRTTLRWIVVGAGSGGAVAAARLTENHDHEVVLLESGAAVAHTDPDPSFLSALALPGRLHDGLTAVRVDGRDPTPYLRGRGLGGSGGVNAMVAPHGGPFEAENLLPTELAGDEELGAVDRALLGASGDTVRAPLTRRHGRRVTVDEAYLRPASRRGNLEVRGDAHVDRILLDGRRAIGVSLVGGEHVVGDRVVVAAGAIHTPAILLRSGVDTPGIGMGLQDHPSAPLTLDLVPGARSAPDRLVVGTLLTRGDIQLLPMNHLGAAATRYGLLMPALMRVRSRGVVTLASDDPLQHPRVEFRMLSHPDDLAGMVRAVALARSVLREHSFRQIVDAVLVDADGTTVDDLDRPGRTEAWLHDHVGAYVHASSSCAMGTVVDELGRVFGYEQLLVCDASVFTEVPLVNTHLPTVMLAETLAARWRTA
jgi:choline dehydrogenase-like flavoprotein